MSALEELDLVDLLSSGLLDGLVGLGLDPLRLLQLEEEVSVLAFSSLLAVVGPDLDVVHIPLLHEARVGLHLIDL